MKLKMSQARYNDLVYMGLKYGPGNQTEVEIERIGILKNPVVAEA